MLELFDDHGNVVGETASSRMRQVTIQARQCLECLADSGATVADLKAFTCALLEEITWASRQVIIDRELSIRRKEREDAEETED